MIHQRAKKCSSHEVGTASRGKQVVENEVATKIVNAITTKRGLERGFFVNCECLFSIAVNRERTKLFPVIRERKYSRDS